MNSALEGDDVPNEANRVWLYGNGEFPGALQKSRGNC